ncbi:MAG TPA: hypothetical protein VHS06_07070 [Chloroflexota bacterium]|nr:hypothetical protein [Chloroflexota bacterium]
MKKLPHIEKIVKQRVAAGIAGDAEFILWLKGDLEDASYSDKFKQQLLDELAEATRQKRTENIH